MKSNPFLLATGLLVFGMSAGATPPPTDCAEIDAEIARATETRRAAHEQSETAWKAVVPFIVLARKANAKQAVVEADTQLAALKAQAQRCGPTNGR